MKTARDLKEEYAKSLGEESWYEFKQNYHQGEIEVAMDVIIDKLLSINVNVERLAKDYIKPIRHQLHLGEEEGFQNDLIQFGNHLINEIWKMKKN